jgi:hypothetical protein
LRFVAYKLHFLFLATKLTVTEHSGGLVVPDSQLPASARAGTAGPPQAPAPGPAPGPTTPACSGVPVPIVEWHTRKEPRRDAFSDESAYAAAWTQWREVRDANNAAVQFNFCI